MKEIFCNEEICSCARGDARFRRLRLCRSARADCSAWGGSGKGLGAAGLDIPTELERCKALVATAKEKGVKILAMHIGGQDRRGPNSEPFLTFMGDADFAVVRADGNADEYFTKLCAEKNVPLYTIEKTGDLRKVMPELLK